MSHPRNNRHYTSLHRFLEGRVSNYQLDGSHSLLPGLYKYSFINPIWLGGVFSSMHSVIFSAILIKIMSTFNHIIANRLFGALKIAISCVQIVPLPPLNRWETRPICTHTRVPGISTMSVPAELGVITLIRRRTGKACTANKAQQPKI